MYLYKAFVFTTNEADMRVDISGDTFSKTAEKAVHSLFINMDEKFMNETFLTAPYAKFFIGSEVLSGKDLRENMYKDSVGILRIELEDDADIPSSLIKELDEKDEIAFAIKNLTGQYKTSLQEYLIENLKVVYTDKGMVENKFTLDLKISNDHISNFPEKIHLG